MEVYSPPQLIIHDCVHEAGMAIPDMNRSIDSDAAIYLIPVEFLNQWRRFIRSPSLSTLPGDLPSGLAADDSLCEHDHVSSRVLHPLLDSPML